MPACTLALLQRVLNAAARFVDGMLARAYATGTMRALHWLTVAYRIRYKHGLVMFAVYNGTSPSYIADTTTRSSTISGHGKLQSTNTSEFDMPGTRTKFEESAFSVAGPREWNALPVAIRK